MMEHSEEYYKMKYFKYKVKYIEELERQKGGGFLKKLGSNIKEGNTEKIKQLKEKLAKYQEEANTYQLKSDYE